MMTMNPFGQRFGNPMMPPGGPMQMPGGMPVNTVGGAPPPGAVQPGQFPAPAPVMPPNAFAQHILAPPNGGGYGVRNMMPGAMPPASAGFRTGAPDPFNALRSRLGFQSL